MCWRYEAAEQKKNCPEVYLRDGAMNQNTIIIRMNLQSSIRPRTLDRSSVTNLVASLCISSKNNFPIVWQQVSHFTTNSRMRLCPLSSPPRALCGLFVKSALSLNLTWHVLSGEIAADESLDLQIKHPLSGLSGPIRCSYPISILLVICEMDPRGRAAGQSPRHKEAPLALLPR